MGLVTPEVMPNKKNNKEQVKNSDIEKMKRGLGICSDLSMVASQINPNNVNYNTEFPAWIYSTCKSAVNYIEGCARDMNVKPSDLKAIKLVKGRRVPVLDTKKAKNRKKQNKKEKDIKE